MNISHKLKFVYVSIPKSGGSSLRAKLHPLSDILPNLKTNSPFYQHSTAKIIKEEFDRQGHNWNEYFKFCFVRNPWARYVSFYSYIEKMSYEWKSKTGKFSEELIRTDELRTALDHQGKATTKQLEQYPTFLDALKSDRFKNENQDRYYNDGNGVCLLDFIGRLENYQEDFNRICDKLGLDRMVVPHANRSIHESYTEYYNDEAVAIVAKREAKVIERFGYKYGEQ